MQSDARPGDAASQAREALVTAPEAVKVISKPWGEERWLAQTQFYAAKLLVLKKGHRLSLQYHEGKHETQYVDRGRIRYTLGSVDRPGEYDELIAEAGTTVIIPPGTIHRMEALEDSRFFEVSTPELSDVVRLEDDYGRAGTSE